MIQVFPNLKWIDDLLECEAVPLVTHFRKDEIVDDDFLRCWHDKENECHVWLYFKIGIHDLVKYKTGRMSLLDVWKASPQIIREVTGVDGEQLSYEFITLADIPEDVRPSADAVLDQEL